MSRPRRRACLRLCSLLPLSTSLLLINQPALLISAERLAAIQFLLPPMSQERFKLKVFLAIPLWLNVYHTMLGRILNLRLSNFISRPPIPITRKLASPTLKSLCIRLTMLYLTIWIAQFNTIKRLKLIFLARIFPTKCILLAFPLNTPVIWRLTMSIAKITFITLL